MHLKPFSMTGVLHAALQDVGMRNAEGNTPLHWACVNAHLKVCPPSTKHVDSSMLSSAVSALYTDNSARMKNRYKCNCSAAAILHVIDLNLQGDRS